MKIRLWLLLAFAYLFACLSQVQAHDWTCQPTYAPSVYHASTYSSQTGWSQSYVIYIESRPQPYQFQTTMMPAFAGNAPNYGANRADRRGHGGSRLGGHTTANWGRP